MWWGGVRCVSCVCKEDDVEAGKCGGQSREIWSAYRMEMIDGAVILA